TIASKRAPKLLKPAENAISPENRPSEPPTSLGCERAKKPEAPVSRPLDGRQPTVGRFNHHLWPVTTLRDHRGELERIIHDPVPPSRSPSPDNRTITERRR